MKNRSGNVRAQSSSSRFTRRRLTALVIASVGVAVVAAGSANADTAGTGRAESAGSTSASYRLGYNKTYSDYDILASRMRAEGFAVEDVDISSRIPAVCANEARSVQTTPGLDGPDFMRGCADGIKSLIRAGIAS
jgi:hypothetical protein